MSSLSFRPDPARLAARHGSCLWPAALIAAALVAAGSTPTARAEAARPTPALVACGPDGRLCGILPRPLDPLGDVPGTLTIGFEYYRHRAAGPALGVLVATEGGPGYPARESRADYLSLYAPLRRRYDILLMDNRGTGSSAAVDCPSLQRPGTMLTIEAVADCGRHLGPAAYLYSSAYAADDLAALLDALGIEAIHLYGDSYGTFTAQTFAVRHPARVRSLVLDGAYPLRAADAAWVPNYAPAMRDKFNTACAREPACAAAGQPALAQIQPALERLRREGGGGGVALATVMFGSAPAVATVRETTAAATAYVAGDRVPLARLFAEARAAVDSRDPTGNARLFSSGLAAAVMCSDAPQLYDMRLEPAARRTERDRLVASRIASHADAYAPFTYDEYRGMPLDYSFLDQCVAWPAITARREASLRAPADVHYPDVPVLVLSGELDNMTSVADGAAAAASFRRGHHVVLRNSLHVNALPRARSTCGAQLVRRFVTTGSTGDERCANAVPPLRLTVPFARLSDEMAPAQALPGHTAGEAALKVASAVCASVADVLIRARANENDAGEGLRGGGFTRQSGPTGLTLRLHDIRWTEDVALEGIVRESVGRKVHADLRVRAGPGDGHVVLTWSPGGGEALLSGELAGRRLSAAGDLHD
jgi:pimeloyl-ACP methyl ester carboxylesterase